MAPSGYWELTYNSKGLLEKEEYFRANRTILNRYTYEYDANDLCIRVGRAVLQKGELVETTVTTFEYETPTQLKKVEMLVAPFSTPFSYNFEYKNGLMDKVYSYNTYGQLDYITTIEYDDKKKAVTLDSGKGNWMGFPYQHNIKELTITTLEGAPLNTGSYTATFEYNPEGYPVKETREFADSTQATKMLEYQCK